MKKYTKKIEFRCPQDIYTWYNKFAEAEGLSLSKLLRIIPKMYKKLEGMNEPYLIIRVGYEGIDKLVWLTGNSDDVVNIRERAIKTAIAEANRRSKKVGIDRIRTDKDIGERFCIQKWTGKRFVCVCKDLGLKTHEVVYY